MLTGKTGLPLLWMAAAVLLEVLANLLIKVSDGFARKRPGLAGVLAVVLSFACLSQAVKGMELSVAYAIWGGCGIVATALLGWAIFGQTVRLAGWAGIVLIVAGILLVKFA